jgi:hypothetical protein
MALDTEGLCFIVTAPPSVSNVRIIGDIVEGNIIKGVGDYFGGKEGPSKFEWLRENKNTGLVCSISHNLPLFLGKKRTYSLEFVFYSCLCK